MEHTIAAISTSTMSSGGISIVRMSGKDAIETADKIFVSKNGKKLSEASSHTVHYGNIVDEDGNIIDEVLVIVMRAPNTYTREDVVEIDCHGGILVTRKVLEAAIKAGAKPAEPGEFTKRAFLNGRIDLSQAEAVIDVINSKNEYALKSSVSQLDGKLSAKIKEIREVILNHVAYIEAALDDPEHISLDNYVNNIEKDVDNCVDNVYKLLKTSDNGRIMRDGIRTVILGKTNAGKSSLLNALAKEERAIVTDIEGTTRDVLEEQVNLGGVTLNLVDTAGIRKTDDYVESIGVEKAKKYAQDADLVIFVVDSSRPLDKNDDDIISLIQNKNVIVLLNKSDMEQVVKPEDLKNLNKFSMVSISAKNETGLDKLEHAIKDMFFNGEISFNEEIYITNVRHKTLLQEALDSLHMVKDGINQGMSEDFLTIDLMTAYEKLGMIIGEEVEDDLADRIFSKFCMGKKRLFKETAVKNLCETYDVVVVGAGHAGCEAALACARLGLNTICFTVSCESIAMMPCNPNIGGSSKGHLVREIDALGGEMGKNIDATFIQSKMLNKSKGPAVHSLRAQADKSDYSHRMRKIMENTDNLLVRQAEVSEIIVEDGIIKGVKTVSGASYFAKAVVLCTGVYLKAKCIFGDVSYETGPNGLLPANHLTQSLVDNGIEVRRFKTGTPARVDKRSIDFSKMTEQFGDERVVPFSFTTDPETVQKDQVSCWLTYTNEETHKIIRDNLDRSPLYAGVIHGTGARIS